MSYTPNPDRVYTAIFYLDNGDTEFPLVFQWPAKRVKQFIYGQTLKQGKYNYRLFSWRPADFNRRYGKWSYRKETQ